MKSEKEMLKLLYEALEEKKAEEIKVLDLHGITVIADYFVIAGGLNKNQLQAMADHVEEVLRKAGFLPRQIEGYSSANWILMDYTDVVIHLFSREDRLFYDLEKIWADAKRIDVADIEKLK